MNKQTTNHYIDQKEIQAYLYDVRKYKALTKAEEIELIKKIKSGCEESKKLLIYTNLRFVIKMAKQYKNQGLDFADLVSEGNYGLLKAAERYNYDQHDIRFLSYAVWWVRQSILQSLHENSRIIRLPVNIINEATKLAKKNPISDEIPETAHPLINKSGITRFDLEMDEGGSLYDIIEDPNSMRPDIKFSTDEANLLMKLKSLLNYLTESEQFIIVKYFGLDGEPVTLQDISEDIGLTKERVRQIKEKALKKLRHHSKELFNLL